MEQNQYFAFNTTTYQDYNTFNPDIYFKEYHHFEPLDKNKEYHIGIFQEDYGYGPLNYIFEKYNILPVIGSNIKQEKLEFVVSVERLAEEERIKLSKYCQCSLCQMSFFNIKRYISCPCCMGCLKTEKYSQSVINRTREYLKK